MTNPLAPSPELPEQALSGAYRFVLGGMAIGAILGSQALRGWTTYLPLWLDPLSHWLFLIADVWNQAMMKIGATGFFDIIRDGIRWFQAL